MIPRDYISGARPHGTDDSWRLARSCGKKKKKKKQATVVTGLNMGSVSELHASRVFAVLLSGELPATTAPSEDRVIGQVICAAWP